MKYLLLFILLSCHFFESKDVKVGECVIGVRMDVWKLLRRDDGKYLFATYPFGTDSPVEIVEDVSAFKKVDCPL